MSTEETKEAQQRLHAELLYEGVSLGSIVTEEDCRLIIGSSKKADLVVPQGDVSHIHAMLRLKSDAILLYDLGSEQGTFVNGAKIVEHRLKPGEFFEIGRHRIRVKLLHTSDKIAETEQFLFWQKAPSNHEILEVLDVRDGIVQDDFSLGKNKKLLCGYKDGRIALPEDGALAARSRESGRELVRVVVPKGFVAEIYNQENELTRTIEQERSEAVFHAGEKLRLLGDKREILLFWRALGDYAGRASHDQERPILQKVMASALALTLVFTLISLLRGHKDEAVEEALTPKSSYFRLSMDAASAPAGDESGDKSEAQAQAAPAKSVEKPSQAASISDSLNKLLKKSNSVSAESIKQAIAVSGKQTARLANIGGSNLQAAAIAGGGLGGGSAGVNAISNGLSGGGGKVGGLKGFGGSGTVGGVGAGFGGKGFDMALGGEEEEAIGGLDKSLIAAVVQANIGQIKHCYEKQLLIDPNLVGKVVAGWTIDKDGKVPASSVKKSTMNSKPVENCIIAKIRTWNFPKPKGGGQVLVSYPFLFKSLN